MRDFSGFYIPCYYGFAPIAGEQSLNTLDLRGEKSSKTDENPKKAVWKATMALLFVNRGDVAKYFY